MDRIDQFFGVHGQALKLRSERMTVLASNIANAATPNYKARDLSFSAALAEAAGPTLHRTNAGHLPAIGAGPEKALLYRQPVQPSLDGNTVEMATEQVQFAETAIQYRSTLSILNGRISSLNSALKGE